MHFTEHQFDRHSNRDFYKTLKKRVNDYFIDNNISKKGDRRMLVKTIVMLSLFIVPYALLLSGIFTNIWLFFGLWFMMGVGVAGIGLSVMHDANHGSLSKNDRLNRVLGRLMDLIGGSSVIWKLQHNVLHHTYTNIDGADEDIEGPPVLRFSPNQKHLFIHRFQHIHAWFFYQLMTFVKVIYTDYFQAIHYKKIGLIKSRKELGNTLIEIFLWKVIYVGYMVVLPMVLLPFTPWTIFAGFLLMHAVIGFSLAVVFQTAHVMPDSAYPTPKPDGKIESDWAVHQLQTTSNFAQNNKPLTWFIGGLNYQVEHHLFSNICHVHYPDIAKIVRQTANEFGVPYRSKKTFRGAIADHARMLYQLGRPLPKPIPVKH